MCKVFLQLAGIIFLDLLRPHGLPTAISMSRGVAWSILILSLTSSFIQINRICLCRPIPLIDFFCNHFLNIYYKNSINTVRFSFISFVVFSVLTPSRTINKSFNFLMSPTEPKLTKHTNITCYYRLLSLTTKPVQKSVGIIN